MTNLRIFGALATAVATTVGAIASPASAQIAIDRVDVDAAGKESSLGGYASGISPNGRYVCFFSWSGELVPGDTNADADVFVKDRTTGLIERVSISTSGEEGDDQSANGKVSVDGNLVVFQSSAKNFFAGDSNDRADVFLRDRFAGVTECISVDSAGAQGNAASYEPAMSRDGRLIVFTSYADNLVPGDGNGVPDVFVRDHVYGRTSRVSVRDGGSGSGNGESEGPSISDDGRYVAFSSVADNLVDGDTNGHWDVFVRDRDTDATERVSVHSSGVEGDSDSLGAMISANGRYVAFSSYAGNLVDDDTNGDVDVFVHDRATGTTRRVSVDSAGRQVGADCYFGSISGDGRIIAFTSASDDLVEDDTNGRIDVFVRDRDLGMTERVSLRADGREADEFSEVPLLSRDGQTIAFNSFASNLVDGDTNGFKDAFVVERCAIDAAWSNYGDGFPGTFGVPALTSSSLPVLGTTVTVDLANSCGQWTYALLFEGFERASIHSSLGGDLLLIPSFTTVVGLPPWGSSYSADLPTNGVFCGVTIDVQAIESDPGAAHGASFTQGLELLLGH
jgi:Tol biopolymer transport system component